MNRFLDQLFGLDRLSASPEGVELQFVRELPAWGWIFVGLACVLVASWSYWKLLGRKPARVALAVMRTLLLALIAVLLAGPQLVRQNERVERDWVVVLADRSASMTVEDAPGGPGAGEAGSSTREEQLARTIRGAWPVFQSLAEDRNLLFLGFDSGAFDLRTIPGDGVGGGTSGLDLGLPRGRRTALGQALEQTLRRVAARPVAGVVVLSDGRSSDTPSRATLRQFESRQIPVIAVPLGSPVPMLDMAIGRVDAPHGAFVGDIVPVTVEVDRLGAGDEDSPVKGRIQLVDEATGRVLDERSLDGLSGPAQTQGGQSHRVTLIARPELPGAAAWTVRLALDGPDLTGENNSAPVRVELVDRPIRVVYFDGYPRWEYRYLKWLLLREKSIRSSTLLLAAERRYIQEGTDTLDTLPRTQAGWAPFDVVVMGDLRPGLFSEDQLNQLKSLISDRGAGLLWIGGSASTPGAWRGSPLADLLPFTLAQGEVGGTGGGPPVWLDPVLIRPGAAAARYGVMQLGESTDDPWPTVLSAPELNWNALRWTQRVDPASLKPTTEVLALATPVGVSGGNSASPTPLVMTMRYGAGRVVYVATDEIWRYRYGRGETLPERFWIPLIRLLARESLGRSGKPAVLRASPERAQAGQQVQFTVQLLDQSLVEARPQSVKVRLIPPSVEGATRAQQGIDLLLKPQATSDQDAPISAFSASWLAGEPGVYRIEAADPLLAGLDLATRLEVVLPDDEMRIPQTDHGALAELALVTGGSVVQPDQLPSLGELLPNRQLRLLGTPDVETLWDKPIVWVLLISLLMAEWVGRRIIKLS